MAPAISHSAHSIGRELEEEFICGCCYDLMILPTTLNCGHSFCRHCLAQWFQHSGSAECPSCRQKFVGLPMVNINIQASMEKLFGARLDERREYVKEDPTASEAVAQFERVLAKRHKDDELSAISGGLIVGVILGLIVVACLYLALAWDTGDNLLVRKPLVKWTVSDVSDWLEDLGLGDYKHKFIEQKINGRMLAEIIPSDLETFGITNAVHQRTFVQARHHIDIHGSKQPSNLWEFKALYPGYSAFLLYSMGHTPRLAHLYLYLYDSDAYEFFYDKCMHCTNANEMTGEMVSFVFGVAFFPHYMSSQFVWCFLDVHYWTSRFLLVQCTCKALLDAVALVRAINNPRRVNIVACIAEPFMMAAVYYALSLVWWLIPSVIRDALFYAEIYFSAFYYIKELYYYGAR